MGCGRDHENFAQPYGQLPEIYPSDLFKKPYPNFRRMDKYSRLKLTAIAFALLDAGLSEWTRERNIGMIASTFYGCLGTDVDYYKTVIPDRGAHASPALFSYTMANSYLGEAAIRFGLTESIMSSPNSAQQRWPVCKQHWIILPGGLLKKSLVVFVMWVVRRFLANPIKCRPAPFFSCLKSRLPAKFHHMVNYP